LILTWLPGYLQRANGEQQQPLIEKIRGTNEFAEEANRQAQRLAKDEKQINQK